MPIIIGISIALVLAIAFGGGVALRVKRRKALEAHAQVLIGWGDNQGAARDLQAAGRWQDAAGLYVAAGDRLQAARLFLEHRCPEKALEALEGSTKDEIEQAGSTLAQHRLLATPDAQKRLAGIAQKAGAFEMAVQLFDCLGDKDGKRASQMTAAKGLADAGAYLEAAALYAELGEKREAAKARFEAARLEKSNENRLSLARLAADEFLEMDDVDSAVEALLVADDVVRAVELLSGAGNEKRAAALLEQKGMWLQASGLYEKSGDLASAARAQKKGGQLHKAASLLEKAGDLSEAARCMAEMHDLKAAGLLLLKGGILDEALQYFAILDDQDLPSVAEELIKAGRLEQAVGLLVRRNQIRTAADLLNAHGQQRRASELLAQLGDRVEQAKLLREEGKYEEAAVLLLEMERPDDAYQTLKAGEMALGQTGRALLARVALKLERIDEAIAIYSEMLESGVAGPDRAEILYGLSRAYESAGKFFEASASLQELLTIDPDHRDAALRLRLMQGRMTPQPFAAVGTFQSGGADHGGSSMSARYRVTGEVGRGSMGVVYRAMDEQLSRPVAIKVLEQQSGAGSKLREYFLREARAVAQLNHPNIVTVYDAGLQDSTPWLVMELVQGEDLRTRFQTGRPTMLQSLKIGCQVAAALDCAHARGIVHRDLKPENIMVSDDGTSKLMDFGIAYVMRSGDQDDGERKNTVVGTPVYMAPEQIRGEQLDGRADIYALGVVLFECFCGRLPFDPEAAMYHNTHTPPPDPRTFRPDLPEDLAALVLQCLAKSPADRPQRASDVERALRKAGARISKELRS